MNFAKQNKVLRRGTWWCFAFVRIVHSVSAQPQKTKERQEHVSHVYLNSNSNTRQSEHLRSLCTRVSGGCRKVLRFLMISGSGVSILLLWVPSPTVGGWGLLLWKWDWSRVQNWLEGMYLRGPLVDIDKMLHCDTLIIQEWCIYRHTPSHAHPCTHACSSSYTHAHAFLLHFVAM